VYAGEGNFGPKRPIGSDADDWSVGFWDLDVYQQSKRSVDANPDDYLAAKPFPAPPITLHSVAELESEILRDVGATQLKRDAVDNRIIDEVRKRTGRTGPSSDYPTLTSTAPPIDTDNDGMPDKWESANRLNPNDPADGPVKAATGHTNVENYLNELARDPKDGSETGRD
jgi:hypothetical protein